MTDAPVGVEEVLRELREMFPNRRIEVHSCWRPLVGKYYFIKVEGKPNQRGSSPTLDAAMDSVRAWKVDHQ